MMLRFAFAMVLAMHAWSSVLLAEEAKQCDRIGDIYGDSVGGMTICGPDYRLKKFMTESDRYTVSGRPKSDDDNAELTATKGDIDALNKRLDRLEERIRCQGAAAADDGVTAPCP
jgi:hypothetical protein